MKSLRSESQAHLSTVSNAHNGRNSMIGSDHKKRPTVKFSVQHHQQHIAQNGCSFFSHADKHFPVFHSLAAALNGNERLSDTTPQGPRRGKDR